MDTAQPMQIPLDEELSVLALDDVARVHLYRWGDGGAHVSDRKLRESAERVAAAM